MGTDGGMEGEAAAGASTRGQDVRAAYRDATAALVSTRLAVAAGFFLFFVGIAVVLEPLYHPERGARLAHVYLVETAVCLAAILTRRVPAVRRWSVPVAAAVCAALASLMIRYNVLVGGAAERCAMFQVCFLSGTVVLLPWGWRAQLAVATASLAGFAIALPHLVASDALAFTVLGMGTGATLSVVGARFLDRYRHDAFVREAQLGRASRVQREEAQVAAALLHVTGTLGVHIDQPDLLQRVNQLAREHLQCGWSATLLWDERRAAFRVHAVADGREPEWRDMVREIELPLDVVPLFAACRTAELIEIADARQSPLVPRELMERLNIRSALVTPIVRGDDVVGIVAHGQGRDGAPGPYTAKQRRLAIGIAQATAVALENARLIADLHAASRLKSEFVATMSHELRTPLNVITGYTDLLVEGAFGTLTADQQDTVARIRRSAFELLDLVNATLDLGRLESGRHDVECAGIDVGGLFDELDREVEAVVPPAVRLRWVVEPGAGQLFTDRAKVKTILKNLVGNALKFTADGTVDVRAARRPDGVALVVRDTGIGIAPADLPVIFDMFRQVDGSATRRFGGVGLGLHIVRRLAGLLGGSVAVESTPHVGSTFTVILPRRDAESARATGT
jgi:signal transduction histidine kinase